MKKLSLLLGVISAVMVPQALRAEDPPKDSSVIFKPIKYKGSRPKAPSRQVVSATISGEYLTVFFVIDEGEYTLGVTTADGVVTEHTNLDSAVPTQVYIGNLESATFEIQTSAGNTYVAEI